jgi:hypothetical protein
VLIVQSYYDWRRQCASGIKQNRRQSDDDSDLELRRAIRDVADSRAHTRQP